MRQTLLFIGLLLMFSVLAHNEAHGQLESLLMPGEVIQGHAEFETECNSCHVKFERSQQRELCMDCHEDVAADLTDKKGFHGRSRYAPRRECSFCHTDHEGRNADIVSLDEAAFRHEFTDFPLEGKHDGLECKVCHEPTTKHREAPSDCVSCHAADDVHDKTMGSKCGDCHSPDDWARVKFDHDSTGYPLIGQHESAGCLDCHADDTFQNTPTTCYGCHAGDDAHDGRSGRECGNCHESTDWLDTSFNHARDTSFALTGKHAQLTCNDCHSDDPFSDTLETTCITCHEGDDNHDDHFGTSCETCHVTDAWTSITFDHAVDTSHALRGAHAVLECTDCHVEPIYLTALPAACGECHEEDDPHDGTQGTICQDCHNEDAWQENVFFDHDLTRFPLLGKHTETECATCHETQVFRDAPEECGACHDSDSPHRDRFPDDCGQCHSPVDWSKWRFDHDLQTAFLLDGAHQNVGCDTCHRQSLDAQTKLGSRCSDCHRFDDIHNGEFGSDCGRCHSTDSFEEVEQIR